VTTNERATILDVAAAAGVSRQTVTRAMNDMGGISAETKERVLAAARSLSYRPSRFGRGLVKGGKHQLGLVINDLRNPYTPELAAAVVREAAQRGWDVMIADVALGLDAATMLGDLASQVDVVVGYLGDRSAEVDELLGGLPVVELDPTGPLERGAVLIDPTEAVAELADHLVAVGVKHPVVLDAASDDGPNVRARIMVDALRARGYLPRHVTAADNADAAAAEVEGVLRSGVRTDAFLAFNDIMAIGALQGCRRVGVAVPEAVRVVGVDGLPLGALVSPTLTTLVVDVEQVARHALDLAIGMHDGVLPHAGDAVVRTVRHRLLLRESA
jgi:DNA-binding LacI/PurR family transcriptional regulator